MPVPASISDLSPIPADNSPTGGEAVFPNLDDYLRAQAAFIAQVRDLIAAGGTPLGSVSWWGGNRTSINSYYLPLDGQVITRSAYPTLWTLVNTGGYPSVSESAWQSSQNTRACFSLGDGTTTFRMPDLNGKQAGSIGSMFLRGDGAGSAESSGFMQDSQILSHNHPITINSAGDHAHPLNDPGHSHTVQGSDGDLQTGGGGVPRAITGTRTTTQSATGITMSSAGAHSHSASSSAVGGSETRGKAATGVWIMRVK